MRRFFKFLPTIFGFALLLVAADVQAQSITLYNGGHYSGGSRTLTDSVPLLGALSFNNKASSVRVTSGTWELCVDPGFGGRCVIVRTDIPRLGTLNLNDKISSVRFIPTVTTPPPSPPTTPPTGPAAPPEAANFSAPTNLTIANTAAGLRLDWLVNSNNEDGFIIELRPPMTNTWILFATISSSGSNLGEYMGSRGYTHSNQSAGVATCYRIRATRGTNRTEPSSSVCAVSD